MAFDVESEPDYSNFNPRTAYTSRKRGLMTAKTKGGKGKAVGGVAKKKLKKRLSAGKKKKPSPKCSGDYGLPFLRFLASYKGYEDVVEEWEEWALFEKKKAGERLQSYPLKLPKYAKEELTWYDISNASDDAERVEYGRWVADTFQRSSVTASILHKFNALSNELESKSYLEYKQSTPDDAATGGDEAGGDGDGTGDETD